MNGQVEAVPAQTSTRISGETLLRIRKWQILLAQHSNYVSPSQDDVICAALDALDRQSTPQEPAHA